MLLWNRLAKLIIANVGMGNGKYLQRQVEKEELLWFLYEIMKVNGSYIVDIGIEKSFDSFQIIRYLYSYNIIFITKSSNNIIS